MAVVGLTPSQQASVDKLVNSGRLEVVVADPQRAASFLARASDAISDVQRLQHLHTAYSVAYDACHDVGEAALAAYGYRTKTGAGQHEALGRFLQAVFDTPPGDAAARTFDKLRRARNANRYEARPVGKAQVTAAKESAQALLEAATARGVGT